MSGYSGRGVAYIRSVLLCLLHVPTSPRMESSHRQTTVTPSTASSGLPKARLNRPAEVFKICWTSTARQPRHTAALQPYRHSWTTTPHMAHAFLGYLHLSTSTATAARSAMAFWGGARLPETGLWLDASHGTPPHVASHSPPPLSATYSARTTVSKRLQGQPRPAAPRHSTRSQRTAPHLQERDSASVGRGPASPRSTTPRRARARGCSPPASLPTQARATDETGPAEPPRSCPHAAPPTAAPPSPSPRLLYIHRQAYCTAQPPSHPPSLPIAATYLPLDLLYHRQL